METAQIRATIKRFFDRPPITRSSLALGWSSFVVLAVIATAFCVSILFLFRDFPLSLWQFIMVLAALRLLMIALASLHEWRALQLKATQPEAAEKHFKWALRLTSGNPDLYCHWGAMLREQEQWSDARQLFERARELSPNYDEPWVQLAYLSLRRGQWKEACRLFDLAYRLRRGVAWNDVPERIPNESPQEPYPHKLKTNLTKLQHDLEQLDFLLKGRYLSSAFAPLRQAYAEILKEVQTQPGPVVQVSKTQHERILLSYGRNIYISPVPAFPRQVLNPDLDLERLQHDFLQGQPRAISVDQLLAQDAIEALLHFCQKSTIWHDDSRPGGYLGAYMDDGFNCELLYQIAQELQEALPQIIEGAPLKHMWAYKYDSHWNEGIGIHGDGAKVNINFWLCPDEGNLDPESGGLLVYDALAPADWKFADYNVDTAKTEAFLKSQQAQYIRIPHRQNRAVIFDSRLFHTTDHFHFQDAFLLRRINVTLLYG